MTYRCGATQDRTVNLIDPAGLMVKRIEPLRTHAWEVELAAHGIDSASLNASSVQLEATCADLNVLDVAGRTHCSPAWIWIIRMIIRMITCRRRETLRS